MQCVVMSILHPTISADSVCHADSMEGLVPVLPFNILEPKVTYSDGEPRHDGTSLSYTLRHVPCCNILSCGLENKRKQK